MNKSIHFFLFALMITLIIFVIYNSESVQSTVQYGLEPVSTGEEFFLFSPLSGRGFVKTNPEFLFTRYLPDGKWGDSQRKKGKLIEVLYAEGGLYLFYENYYLFNTWTEKGWKGGGFHSYPLDWKPLAMAYSPEKGVVFWGGKDKEIRLWHLWKGGRQRLPYRGTFIEGMKNFQALIQEKSLYLFFTDSEGVSYLQWNWREPEVKKSWEITFFENQYDQLAIESSPPQLTSLDPGPYALFSSPQKDKIYLAGDGKRLDSGQVRFRLLQNASEDERLKFQAVQDLHPPLSSAPQALGMAEHEEKLFIFASQGKNIYYTQRGDQAGGEWKSLQNISSSLRLPLVMKIGLVLLALFLFGGLLANYIRKKNQPMAHRQLSQIVQSEKENFAPLWRRGLAYAIDISLALLAIQFFEELPPTLQDLNQADILRLTALFYLICLPYFAFCEYFFHQTLGKYLLRIKVIGEEGDPTLAEVLVRNGMRFVDDSLYLTVGVVCILLTKKSQRVGDLLAGTMVVETGSVLYVKVNETKKEEEE